MRKRTFAFVEVTIAVLVAVVIFFALALLLPGCQPTTDQDYPILALSKSYVGNQNIDLNELKNYHYLYGSMSTETALTIKRMCHSVEHDIRIIQVILPLTCSLERNNWAEWIAEDNPHAALMCAVWDNADRGVDWFLRDQQGKPFKIWSDRHYLLNLSPECPRGVAGDTKGLTFSEYLRGPWIGKFRSQAWQLAFDGVQIEDGPFCGFPCWFSQGRKVKVGHRLLDPSCSKREYQKHVLGEYNQFLSKGVRRLGTMGIITRCNGHFDETVCPNNQFTEYIGSTFMGCKLESFGNWGGCPKRDWRKWFNILQRIPDRFQPFPPSVNPYQGWGASVIQATPSITWSLPAIAEYERIALAMSLMTDCPISFSWAGNFYGLQDWRDLPIIPEATQNLGMPVDDAVVTEAQASRTFVTEDGVKTTVIINLHTMETEWRQ